MRLSLRPTRTRAPLGASLTYTGADGRWFARVYGRNLADKIYKESAQNVDPLWVWAFYGEPRFVGGEIGMKFGQHQSAADARRARRGGHQTTC